MLQKPMKNLRQKNVVPFFLSYFFIHSGCKCSCVIFFMTKERLMSIWHLIVIDTVIDLQVHVVM